VNTDAARYFVVLVAFSLLCAAARAETLALPENLVDLRSKQGEQLLLSSDAIESYVSLSSNFVTQKNQAFCGIASLVIVLNTLEIPGPATPEYEPYRTFTQDNVFDDRTEQILPREVLLKRGMTLDQLGRLLELHPVAVDVRHAADGSLDEFRSAAREHLAKDRAVIVNYLRKAIGEERGGHISPLAAYDAQADRFLILDVARYKYPPVWVKTAELFAAMNTIDADNQNKTRGYVVIRKLPREPAALAN
jgi:hypothetical protein